MIEDPIHQNIKTLNMQAPNNRASKYMNQEMKEK